MASLNKVNPVRNTFDGVMIAPSTRDSLSKVIIPFGENPAISGRQEEILSEVVIRSLKKNDTRQEPMALPIRIRWLVKNEDGKTKGKR
jgi:hypothetical protein